MLVGLVRLSVRRGRMPRDTGAGRNLPVSPSKKTNPAAAILGIVRPQALSDLLRLLEIRHPIFSTSPLRCTLDRRSNFGKRPPSRRENVCGWRERQRKGAFEGSVV